MTRSTPSNLTKVRHRRWPWVVAVLVALVLLLALIGAVTTPGTSHSGHRSAAFEATAGLLPKTTTSTATLTKTATTTDHEPFESSQQAAEASAAPVPSPAAVPSAKQTQSAVALASASGKCRTGSPLANVYHPYRLEVIKDCITATGTVTRVRYEDDGDVHINLSLPATEQKLLNNANLTDEHGDLVTEIVPADQPGCTPGKPPPLPVTAYRSPGYTYGTCTGADLPTPALGDQVSVTGPYVLDTDHGWMEVHPVWSIVIRASATGTATPTTSARTIAQWSQHNEPSVTGLMRAAVAFKAHPGSLMRCAVLAHALRRTKRTASPPNARLAWRHALRYLLSAATFCHAHTEGYRGRTRVRVVLGLRLLRRFGSYLAHRGIRLGEELVILVASPVLMHGSNGSATTSKTRPPIAASPTTSVPRSATTLPPPPTTTTSPAPPTTTTEPPPPPTTTTSPPPPPGAWCTATAAPANDGYPGDYDVFVHSNQPFTNATVSDATDTYGYETNATGYADIYLWTQYPGEPVSVTVGSAHCSTSI